MKKNRKILIFINIAIQSIVYISTIIFGLFLVAFNCLPSKELTDVYNEATKVIGLDAANQIQDGIISRIDFERILNFFYRIRNLVAILVERLTNNLFKITLSINFESALISCYYHLKHGKHESDIYRVKQDFNYHYFDNFSVSRKFLVNCILTC